jgi:hypothetical protein
MNLSGLVRSVTSGGRGGAAGGPRRGGGGLGESIGRAVDGNGRGGRGARGGAGGTGGGGLGGVVRRFTGGRRL